ncbi:cGMP-dependent protein kinase 2 isoform X1 [Sphaerodactylus townsendi]|uniref:cGMP-dependent protein kinase 2 isoform X1 n=1 Tax=Sphaerodactylus townsendi TaxID=933632 RepID=UPI0020274631|nr:cGMP-dependent protein kinase 2 isoform X1 [Sphaerodactylus townsendi]
MGNGSVKHKYMKRPDSHAGSCPYGCSGSGKLGKDQVLNISTIAGAADILRGKVWELERELKRQEEDIQERSYLIIELQEQLAKQTRTIAELTEELKCKCIQLNKLQDVVDTQGANPFLFSPLKEAPRVVPAASNNRRRGAKEGVSAEPTTRTYDLTEQPRFSFEKARVRKPSSEKKLITDALNRNQFLKRLDQQQIRDMVECMYGRTYQQGSYIIKQGEAGNHIFVLAEGRLEVFQQNKLLSSIPVWTAFGELAILYNCTRTASVKAVTSVKTWALDREVFQNIMRRTAQTRHEQYRNFLRSVSLLKNLPDDKLTKIIDCLEVEYYDKGDYVIREGEEGNTFFVIARGKVKVTKTAEGCPQAHLIKTLQKGDYFGEKALISDDVRSANIVADENDVECLVIDRETFNQMVGTFEELQAYLTGYVANLARDDEKRQAQVSSSERLPSDVSLEMIQLREKVTQFPSTCPFQNLEIVATLGVGGFGRVELVKVKNENTAFAMKCIKKKHVVDTKQQEHIHSEKKILEEACSPFIVKLYRTFKDNKYVYMLLEACLGGELWSILRDRGSFDETTTKFCVGCVTEAVEYLHHISVIYRDLKPENLILDAQGYVKLVDFGFAKKIGAGQKTWTFCGTPEYVAPEVILNKGHDFSVDFWSLGILVYELLTGNPPFSGVDQMMTYNLILKGVERLDFPRIITKRPEDLIRRLCRQNPTERLGNLKNGIHDIKRHRWLNGFNWEGLRARKITSPLKRELSGPMDYSYFDRYPPEQSIPPDELSGWDKDF